MMLSQLLENLMQVTCSPNSSPKSDTISDEGRGRGREERAILRGTDSGSAEAD